MTVNKRTIPSGGRPLKRFLQRELETRIGRQLIAGGVPDGSTVHVDLKDGGLVVATRAAEPARA